MREELKRINYIGDPKSIFAFACISVTEKPVSFSSISSMCSLNPSINVKPKPCLAFLEEIGFVCAENSVYGGTERGLSAIAAGAEGFTALMSEQTLIYMLEEGYISPEAIIYDHNTNSCIVKKSGVSFTAAVLRNYLLDTESFIENEDGNFVINKRYEALFENKVKNHRNAMSLEKLLELHERQAKQGRLAEEFVVDFEKRRLLWCENSNMVKQISDLDVGAGYDVISFNDSNSEKFDRFIEVKSFIGSTSFFWSSNEMKTAKKIGQNYYLYLVDMEEYLLPGYEPIIIRDPANTLLSADDWVQEIESLKLTKV